MELLEKAEPTIRQRLELECFAQWRKDTTNIVPAIKLQLLDDFFAVTLGLTNE